MSPQCVTCTVIHGHVLGSQAVHLQVQRVLAVVSGDGESAPHGVCVVCATTTANICYPLQPLPWSLTDPAHVVPTEGESRGCRGESQGPPGFTRSPPGSTNCSSRWTPADTRHHGQELSHTHGLSPADPLSYSMSLVHYELPFKRATRKTQPSTNSMVSSLCSVLVLIGTPANPAAGAPLPAAGSGFGCFNQQREAPICMSSDSVFSLGSILT